MPSLESIKRAILTDAPAIAVLALAAGLQVAIISAPIGFLVTNVLPDDAFYYFEIARNLAAGNGSTFDGSSPTNGYHPLWMLLLLPIFQLASVGGAADILPIRIALAVCVVANAGTGLMLLRVLRRFVDRPLVRALALALWSLNPFVLFETVNGLETAVAMATFSAFAYAAIRTYEAPTLANRLLVSVAAGVMILARLDLAVYFAVYLLAEVGRLGVRHGLARTVPMGLIATALCVPWFAWNAATFGMVFTSASNGASLINHTLVVADNGPGITTHLKGSLYLMHYHGSAVLERLGAAWLYFGLVGAALAHLAGSARARAAARRYAIPLLVFSIGFGTLFFANAGVRFVGRAWYFISGNLILAVVAGSILAALVPRARERAVLSALALGIFGSFLAGWHTHIRDQFANQGAMYAMAGWINEHLPSDTRVGVFNAGVQGYFAQAHVINLDGLVNNDAYEAIRDRRLWSYIRESDIAYLSDFPLYLSYRHRPFVDTDDPFRDLREIHEIPANAGDPAGDRIVLYRLLR